MKKALFNNWSNEAFTHAYNSELYTFKDGESYEMVDYLAEHFAKHLTNRELAKTGIEANIRAMSPKEPQKSAIFMKFFNKAYKELGPEEMSEEKVSVKLSNIVADRKKQGSKAKFTKTTNLTSNVDTNENISKSTKE